MSTLANFLLAKEPLFDHALAQLEERTGRHGVDIRLGAEIAEKAASSAQAMRLDHDYTALELYGALLAQVKTHDEHLARAIGGKDPEDLAEMIPLIVAAVQKVDMPKKGYFIHTDKARDMLRHMPPPGTMQRLGYSDVEELLRNEDIHELFLALRFAEEPEWLNAYDATYRSLESSDFEARDIAVVVFDPEKWGDIAEHFIHKKLHNIANSKELGVIGVMPMTMKRMKGVTLKVMPLLFHYFNELRLYSAFFKLVHTKKNFGAIVADTLIADPSHVNVVAGHHIHWRVIQRYFGKLKAEKHPEIFEPHVQPEDLHWRKAEEYLYQVDPELEFWRELDYVAVSVGGETITFNLMDVSLSYSNGLAFADRYLYHFRESLWNEVFARYMGESVLEQQILTLLDNAVIKPETLTAA
jgi:hypothetical protein